jgi:CheY-like chemotaxis protein
MPHHLLLVDDEAHNRKLLRMVLRQGGYDFSEAENGNQALEILGRERIDLILLDLMMPSPNGFDVLLAVKKSDRLRDIPVLVASASTAPDDVERSLTLGAADYFMKPLTSGTFLPLPIKVRNALSVNQASGAPRAEHEGGLGDGDRAEPRDQQSAQVIREHALPSSRTPPETRDKVARIRAATETIAGLTQRIATPATS